MRLSATIREGYPTAVEALERKHDGRFLTPAEIRDILNGDTTYDVDGDQLSIVVEGKWVLVSHTDLFDRVHSYHWIRDDEATAMMEHLCSTEHYGAILSERDGLVLIDSMTDG